MPPSTLRAQTLSRSLNWSPVLGRDAVFSIAASIAAMSYSYWRLKVGARVFGEYFGSCFDVHRWLLYKALRLRLPKNPAEESSTGNLVTQYLWRGIEGTELTYVDIQAQTNSRVSSSKGE